MVFMYETRTRKAGDGTAAGRQAINVLRLAELQGLIGIYIYYT